MIDKPTYKGYNRNTVFSHTIAALYVSDSNNPLINISILLHDVGKAATRSYGEDGRVHYYRHEIKSESIINNICDRLKITNDDREAILFASVNHMKFHALDKMKNPKVFDLMKNKNFEILYHTAKADNNSRGEKFFSNFDRVDKKIESVNSIINPREYNDIRKSINGDIICKVLNIKPGPILGVIIKNAMDFVITNKIKDKDLIIKHIIQEFPNILKNNRM